TGICVAYIPSSESIQDIQDDILFLGEVMGVSAKARELVTEMDREIAIIATIGNSITEKKRVYYEIAAAPYLYSFGSGTFLHEMLEIIGAINILAEVNSWAAITDEVVIDANPDVILTSVNYLDDPIGEILARPGWEAITAVANEEVYYIDNDASSRPNHHITKALIEMAKAIYPDLY
ncbi:MAG: ABC transporter substrate-binding protein, partial [Symbiobacteriaceae bacterium]|nr:ABC transporter substrate-binding protein [Symbiobacteriaceae bacterium]